MSAAYRLNRLFHPRSKRCINVAVDHGFFGEPRFLLGIEDMPAVVETLIRAGPDAIQLTAGQAPLLQSHAGRDKPALVLRVDAANVYGLDPPRTPFSVLVDDAVGHAVRLDAACVCANLFDIPGMDDLRRQCLENIAALRAACDRAGMPLMVEPLVMKPGGGGYEVDGMPTASSRWCGRRPNWAPTSSRPTPPTISRGTGASSPLRGARARAGRRPRARRRTARTHPRVLEQGAAGIVYGRNVIQHSDPAGMVGALRAVVHGARA